jgi:hypothetical protein
MNKSMNVVFQVEADTGEEGGRMGNQRLHNVHVGRETVTQCQ